MSRYGYNRRGVKDEKKVKSEYGLFDAPRRRSGDRLNEVQRYAMSKYDPIKFTEPKAPSLSEMPRDPYVIEVDGVRQCALCNVQFTSTTCEMTHLQGKRHRMALQGKILNKKGKRVGPTEDFGRCDVCNVDYTSAQQRNTHVQGKRHIRNVQMAQRGITPGARRKRTMNMSGNYGTYQFPGFGNYNYNNSQRELLEHEKLQKEVEKMYAEYLEIAKTDMDKAKELYKTYQVKYKNYVSSYNDYAAKYREAQAKRSKEQQERTASNTPSTTTTTTNGNTETNGTTTTTNTNSTTNTTTAPTTTTTPKQEPQTEEKKE